jgi:hypothetical protein
MFRVSFLVMVLASLVALNGCSKCSNNQVETSAEEMAAPVEGGEAPPAPPAEATPADAGAASPAEAQPSVGEPAAAPENPPADASGGTSNN